MGFLQVTGIVALSVAGVAMAKMALCPKRTMCHREFDDKHDHNDLHGHHGCNGHHHRHSHCHQRHSHRHPHCDHQKTEGDSNDLVIPIVEGTETKQA